MLFPRNSQSACPTKKANRRTATQPFTAEDFRRSGVPVRIFGNDNTNTLNPSNGLDLQVESLSWPPSLHSIHWSVGLSRLLFDIIMKTSLVSLLLVSTVEAFLVAKKGPTALFRSQTRIFDTEKPDSRGVGDTFNFTAAQEKLKVPVLEPEQELKEPEVAEVEEEHKTHVPHKIAANGKELWYDEESGKFYEACPYQKIPLATIFERSLDTVEDAVLHLRRVPYEKGWLQYEPAKSIPTVVVLGSGWASHALIKVADTYKMRLIVVSPVNHFVFTPSKFRF